MIWLSFCFGRQDNENYRKISHKNVIFEFVKRKRLISAAAIAALALLFWAAFLRVPAAERELARLDRLCARRKWERMVQITENRPPRSTEAMCYRNLALSILGRLDGDSARIASFGPRALVPEARSSSWSNRIEMEILYWTGVVNISRRFAFEAQMAQGARPVEPRAQWRIAESDIVLGLYEDARKHLHVLEKCPLHRRRAIRTAELLGSEEAIARHPEFGLVRSRMPRESDMFFSEEDFGLLMNLLCTENPGNNVAAQYLRAWETANKNIGK